MVEDELELRREQSERRWAEQELADQKGMLQTIFDHAPVMITMLEDGELQMINAQIESVLGWRTEDLDAPADLLERCYPDPEVRQDVIDTIEEAPDEWRDHRPQRADGTRIGTTWKNVSLGNGRTIGFGVDISKRKRRERALEDANRRLRLALEAADAGTFEHDLTTDEVRWDERTLDLYGLPPELSVRLVSVIMERVLDEDLPALKETLHRAVEGEERYDLSFRIRRADDGEDRWIRTRGEPLWENGEIARVRGAVQDITERKKREQKLERQNDLFSKAQDIARVGAWEYDVRSDETVVTNQVYQIHGMASDSDIGPEDTIDLFHPDDQSTLQTAFRRAINEGASYDLELRMTTDDDGEERWVRTRGGPQREDEDVVWIRLAVPSEKSSARSRAASAYPISECSLGRLRIKSTDLRYEGAASYTQVGMIDWTRRGWIPDPGFQFRVRHDACAGGSGQRLL